MVVAHRHKAYTTERNVNVWPRERASGHTLSLCCVCGRKQVACRHPLVLQCLRIEPVRGAHPGSCWWRSCACRGRPGGSSCARPWPIPWRRSWASWCGPRREAAAPQCSCPTSTQAALLQNKATIRWPHQTGIDHVFLSKYTHTIFTLLLQLNTSCDWTFLFDCEMMNYEHHLMLITKGKYWSPTNIPSEIQYDSVSPPPACNTLFTLHSSLHSEK